MKINRRMLVSALCGVCCAACVGLYLVDVRNEADQARAEALARYGGDQIEVCVANRDIAAGEVVENGAVSTKMWVADLLPDGAVTDPAQVVGQRLGSAVYRGEVMSDRRLEAAESELSVPEGMAAVSVPARAVQAVGGSVEAGMVVDVYATGPVSTVKLVAGALVLASSASTEGAAASNAAWVTLAVEPERVQEVVAAAQNLELYFALPSAAGGAEDAADASLPADAAEQDAAGDTETAAQATPAAVDAGAGAAANEGAVL
ncbi:Flp pilus assembly protein CpaB [Adlercreutzia sp. R21]|uniref:Flp pilus assembly protein CpaB n=1 Tax=Adlercreutzia wanghongyangiae TaxID=3111451 RepID=UPI002DB6EC75|nr:Flp pilus assembly protein CpaB [Adlercreutzia sp. R21]MEC4184674.1 Flp pilus assembly protein CpaB [Adlercreutzia sp. R21]